MAKPGDIIENPVGKHRVKFLTTTAETNGERLVMEYTILPGGVPSPWHIHTGQDEYFECVSGTLELRLFTYENVVLLQPGEKAVAPRPYAHQFANASETEPVTFIFELRPAQQFEQWLETYYGYARDGLMNDNGIPHDLLQALVLAEMTDTYLVGIPASIQKVPLQIGAAVARLFGRRKRYPQYSQF